MRTLSRLRALPGATALVAGLVTLPAAAAPVLQLDGLGHLTGASGVVVEGAAYDVRFVDGSCNSIFGTCTQASFAFDTAARAIAAAQALFDQVLLDLGAGADYDSQPALLRGCESATDLCIVYSTYAIQYNGTVSTSTMLNFAGAGDTIVNSVYNLEFAQDTTPTIGVYAVWTKAAAAPEPSTLALAALAVSALALRRRRR